MLYSLTGLVVAIGFLYRGDLQPGDRAATPEEVAVWELFRNPLPTPEDRKASLIDAIQAHLDAGAQALGYDDIKTAATYADEPAVPHFQREGRALRAWRSYCWEHCRGVLAAVTAGERPIPTAAKLIDELPPLRMEAA